MKYIVTIIGIVLSFGLLFTASSGIFTSEVFAYEEERKSYYPQYQYNQDSFYGIDKELLEEIENKLFDGIDKDLLVNNALNLLNEYDIDIGALNEQLPQDGGYGGAFVLILVLFILLVIIGAGFGLGW